MLVHELDDFTNFLKVHGIMYVLIVNERGMECSGEFINCLGALSGKRLRAASVERQALMRSCHKSN